MKKTIFISLCVTLALTACSTESTNTAQETTAQATSAHTTAATSTQTEVSTLPTRVVISYNGGILTIDPESGDILADEKVDGFMRLNNAADNRNVFVTHGDHNHYYTQDPALTDTTLQRTEGRSCGPPRRSHRPVLRRHRQRHRLPIR